MKTCTLNGNKYHIDTTRLDGLCDPPDSDRPTIRIVRGLRNKQGCLETVIHEALHACDWPASEDEVAITAKDIARLLWNLGWRLK